MKIKKEDLLDRLWAEGKDPGCVETGRWKWGVSEMHVFFIDEKYWSVWLNFHPEDGIQLYEDEVELSEVKPVEITTIKWESVSK